MQCGLYCGEPITTARWSGQGVVAHETSQQYMWRLGRVGDGDPVYGDGNEMKDSTCTALPEQRHGNWQRARFRYARIRAFALHQLDVRTRRLVTLTPG